MTCYLCSNPNKETRPYGPGGQSICFACMKADSNLEDEAKKNFGALIEAAEALGNGNVLIGSEDGPTPFIPEEHP